MQEAAGTEPPADLECSVAEKNALAAALGEDRARGLEFSARQRGMHPLDCLAAGMARAAEEQDAVAASPWTLPGSRAGYRRTAERLRRTSWSLGRRAPAPRRPEGASRAQASRAPRSAPRRSANRARAPDDDAGEPADLAAGAAAWEALAALIAGDLLGTAA